MSTLSLSGLLSKVRFEITREYRDENVLYRAFNRLHTDQEFVPKLVTSDWSPLVQAKVRDTYVPIDELLVHEWMMNNETG